MFWFYAAFLVLVLALLWVDLFLLHREAGEIRFRQALGFSSVCAALAVAFAGVVYLLYEQRWFGFAAELPGNEAALQFFTGWLLEQSLSLDNVFVIAVVFRSFAVPLAYQHRVLFWGILGALVMRGVMIAAGTALIRSFGWVTYAFGAILLLTAWKMYRARGSEPDPTNHVVLRLSRRILPVSPELHGQRFLVRIDGRRMVTPLFLVLLVIESLDVVFAVDSIPAVLAVTRDPFLVFTSNVFAILNLRSLYFVLTAVLDRFHHIQTALVIVLGFVGVKMILAQHFHVPTLLSLAVILLVLLGGVIASILRPLPPKVE